MFRQSPVEGSFVMDRSRRQRSLNVLFNIVKVTDGFSRIPLMRHLHPLDCALNFPLFSAMGVEDLISEFILFYNTLSARCRDSFSQLRRFIFACFFLLSLGGGGG